MIKEPNAQSTAPSAPAILWHAAEPAAVLAALELGTRPVLIGVATVVAAQLAFTYLPPMQVVFDSRPVSLLEGLAIIGIGAVLLVIVEIEKRVASRLQRNV